MFPKYIKVLTFSCIFRHEIKNSQRLLCRGKNASLYFNIVRQDTLHSQTELQTGNGWCLEIAKLGNCKLNMLSLEMAFLLSGVQKQCCI